MKTLESLKPWLDTEDKFLAFIIPKCASTSILYHLDDRVIRPNRPQYKDKLEKINLDEVFKFIIVRNPYDRIVSSFSFLKQDGYINRSFKEFVLNELPHYDLTETVLEEDETKKIIQRHCSFQYTRYNPDYVDYIGRVDNIEHDWKVIASNIDSTVPLPHYRKSTHKKYMEYYDGELIEIVSKIYSRDIETFGFGGDGLSRARTIPSPW